MSNGTLYDTRTKALDIIDSKIEIELAILILRNKSMQPNVFYNK